MKKNISTILLIIIIFTIFVIPSTFAQVRVDSSAQLQQSNSNNNVACNCPPKSDTATTFKQSDLVLIGTVSEITQNSNYKDGYSEVMFNIRKLMKGVDEISDAVVIYVPNDKCKFEFQNGYDYIVYAKGDIFFYSTDICTRNQFFDNAYEEIEALKKIDKSSNNSKLQPSEAKIQTLPDTKAKAKLDNETKIQTIPDSKTLNTEKKVKIEPDRPSNEPKKTNKIREINLLD